ncbi:Hypothetical_protein [Hexamita inflata]|uniref:Hypothetical_protein n=1 Tax=Hexamita inflata TaxID=28002 RepID=A0AA86PDQ9_9EUKA|nr:Hypothetical protein HINF_LOCUS24357 [Hexamita inflata]
MAHQPSVLRFNPIKPSSEIMTIHKSTLSYTITQPQTNLNIIPNCHSEQPPQTTKVSSASKTSTTQLCLQGSSIFACKGVEIGNSLINKNVSKMYLRIMSNLNQKTRLKRMVFVTCFQVLHDGAPLQAS